MKGVAMLFRKTNAHDGRPVSVCDTACRAEAIRDRPLTAAAERFRV
jgi:hypothetical protein